MHRSLISVFLSLALANPMTFQSGNQLRKRGKSDSKKITATSSGAVSHAPKKGAKNVVTTQNGSSGPRLPPQSLSSQHIIDPVHAPSSKKNQEVVESKVESNENTGIVLNSPQAQNTARSTEQPISPLSSITESDSATSLSFQQPTLTSSSSAHTPTIMNGNIAQSDNSKDTVNPLAVILIVVFSLIIVVSTLFGYKRYAMYRNRIKARIVNLESPKADQVIFHDMKSVHLAYFTHSEMGRVGSRAGGILEPYVVEFPQNQAVLHKPESIDSFYASVEPYHVETGLGDNPNSIPVHIPADQVQGSKSSYIQTIDQNIKAMDPNFLKNIHIQKSDDDSTTNIQTIPKTAAGSSTEHVQIKNDLPNELQIANAQIDSSNSSSAASIDQANDLNENLRSSKIHIIHQASKTMYPTFFKNPNIQNGTKPIGNASTTAVSIPKITAVQESNTIEPGEDLANGACESNQIKDAIEPDYSSTSGEQTQESNTIEPGEDLSNGACESNQVKETIEPDSSSTSGEQTQVSNIA